MSQGRKIVITGAGAICGAGRTVDSIWEALVNGRSAITPVGDWEAGGWPARLAAPVTGVDNRELVEDRKLHKMISRTDLFGLYAADQAIRQSGLLAQREGLEAGAAAQFNDRTGVFAGSGGGNYRSNYDFFPAMAAAGGSLQKFGAEFGNSVHPMWLLRNLPNNVLCHVGIRHGFKGTNACITNQCAGGAMALAEAAAALQAGEADRAVAVGHDTPIEPETIFNYHHLGLLSPEPLRPFHRDRKGTVFGEGAAAVVLEAQEQARARGAAPLGEFLGSGCVSEATGIVDVRPDGEGVSRAIGVALQNAGISPDAVGMIVAHGNGTRASDASEAAGIARVFGERIPPVTGFKWACGHLIAASGALDFVLALKALRQGVVPGIANLDEPDPALGRLPVSRAPQKPRSDVAVLVCRGFGGMNVALVVRAG